MFEIVLTISVLLVLIAVAFYRAHPVAVAFIFGLAFLVSYPFFSFTAKPLFAIYPALLAVLTACRRFNVRRNVFASCAALSVAGVWGVAMLLFLPRWREIQRLDAEYPSIRMDERLAYENQAPKEDKEDAGSIRRSLPSESEIEEATGIHYRWDDRRSSALKSLERTHESFVSAFAEQEEFGFFRMYHMPATIANIRLREPPAVSLPDVPPASISAGERSEDEIRPPEDPRPLSDFHRKQAIEFVNPQGFGASLDGQRENIRDIIGATRVRGFQPHAFREPPAASPAGDDWQLTKLELVSLLKHDPPAVYVSDHLPRMQELSSDAAPTRPLDAFESDALERLLDGETTVVGESRNRIRMFGGLRAAQQCRQCHRVGEGHLLGAFTYEFHRKLPLPAAKDEPRQAPKPLL